MCLSSKESYKTELSQCLGFINSVIFLNIGTDVVLMWDMNFTYSNDDPWLSMFVFNFFAQLYFQGYLVL